MTHKTGDDINNNNIYYKKAVTKWPFHITKGN